MGGGRSSGFRAKNQFEIQGNGTTTQKRKILTMYLYRTSRGTLARSEKSYFQIPDNDFDELLSHQSLYTYLSDLREDAKAVRPP